MKKLKSLNIVFSTHHEFLVELKSAVLKNKKTPNRSIDFDSMETFKRFITTNKLEILMAIARLKPNSINQLAKLIHREYPHVLKDCRALELSGFIKLEPAEGIKKQFIPKLAFDYDVIRVKAQLEEFLPISEAAHQVLRASMVS